jgi:hypothetical protein
METAGFHGTLDQKLVNALRILFNEVSDETVSNTIHHNNLDDTEHPIKSSCRQLDYHRHLVLTIFYFKILENSINDFSQDFGTQGK